MSLDKLILIEYLKVIMIQLCLYVESTTGAFYQEVGKKLKFGYGMKLATTII